MPSSGSTLLLPGQAEPPAASTGNWGCAVPPHVTSHREQAFLGGGYSLKCHRQADSELRMKSSSLPRSPGAKSSKSAGHVYVGWDGEGGDVCLRLIH